MLCTVMALVLCVWVSFVYSVPLAYFILHNKGVSNVMCHTFVCGIIGLELVLQFT